MTYGARQTVHLDAEAAPQSYAPVVPRCVFAAGRKSFDAVVRNVEIRDAKALLFRELPLAENGWDIRTTKVRVVGHAYQGLVVKVERPAP